MSTADMLLAHADRVHAREHKAPTPHQRQFLAGLRYGLYLAAARAERDVMVLERRAGDTPTTPPREED